MFKKISLALLVGVGAVVTGVFEAPANAKSYKSVSAYCNAEHSSAVENCKKKVSEHRNKFPVPNAPKDNSQGTNRKSPQSERVGTDATSSSQQTPQSVSDEKNKSVSLPQTGQTTSESSTSSAAQKIEGVLPEIQRSQSQGETNQQNKPSEPGEQAQSSSQSEKSEPVGSEPSGSDQTSTRSPLPQQQTGSPNGTEVSEPKSSEDFGALVGNQSVGDPIKSEGSSSNNQEAIPETEEPKSVETQTEKEQSSTETRESSEEDQQSAEGKSSPQNSPKVPQEESVLDEKEGESTKETEKTPSEKERSAKQEDVSDQEENGSSKYQLSEKKVEAFCGKQNVMAGTGSKEVYNRCITQVEKHPSEFPQLHKSETTKPSADSEDEASASDASSASEEKNANESEKQEQIENKEEREREDRDKDGKVQTETSVDQPTPNEGENAEKGNNDPPQKLRNMSHSELYDRFCNVKEISGDAPRQKMVQKVVNKHVQCHKRMIRAIQKEKYAQMRTMIQQQRKKMQEERPTLQVKAAAQFSGNGDLQTRVGVQDQRFNAQAVYRPNSERSLDVSATHQITDKEDEFPLNILTPVRVGAGLKNVHGETSIGPRINAGILELQVDVVNGNGVSAGINIFNF